MHYKMSTAGKFMCTYEECNSSFNSLDELESHKSLHSNPTIHNKMSSPKKQYMCAYKDCDSSFSKFKRLANHIKLHSNERPYICSYDDCNKSYTQLQHLIRHREVHGEIFKCTELNCEMVFKYKSSLKKHIDNIHLRKNSKTYQCSYCEEQFNKHSWLRSHETKHTGIYPHVCPHKDCGKRFLVPSKLKRHLKVHEGYTCNIPNCNKKFPKWSVYRKHLQVAHPTVYICNICEKKFSTSNNLKNHSEVHDLDRTVYPCPQPNCCRFYTMKRNLDYHIKSYHGKRPFACSEENCYKAFKTEADMNKHYLQQHDPSTRPRRKKKKSKPKPNFAATLAGCIKKKTKLPKIGDRSEISVQVSASEECQRSLEEETQYIIQTSENVCVELGEECQNVPVEENLNKSIGTSKEVSANQNVDDDIQELVNMINERDAMNTISVAKFVSFKEFIKL